MARIDRKVLGLVACGLVAGAVAAGAQSNDEINSGIQFNFSTPGARSLGLGGAFLALADDATAAFANPAGLTNLTVGGPEVSIELRNWGFDHRFNLRGRSSGATPTGVGLDTLAGIETGESSSETQGLSFASFGYVLPRGATLALYRHQLADFKAEIETEGIFVGSNRTNPVSSQIDLDIASYGAALAYAFAVPEPGRRRPARGGDAGSGPGPAGERGGSLALGLALSYYQLQLDSLTRRFGRANRSTACLVPGDSACFGDRQPGGFYGPTDRLDDNVLNRQSQHGDDADVAFNAGLLWRVDSARRWSLGAVYRRGPRFDVRVQREPLTSVLQPGATIPCLDPTQHPPCPDAPALMRVPDVLGLGIAWSAAEGRTKLLLDVDRVRYSQLTDRLVNLFTVADDNDLKDFRIDDGDEIHLGFEHVLPLAEPRIVGTLRLGAWYDPAHSLEYRGSKTLIAVRFPEGKGEVHYAAGAGIVFQENFQVDAAVDLSQRVDTISVSVVKFF